jgi:hypothetical protein
MPLFRRSNRIITDISAYPPADLAYNNDEILIYQQSSNPKRISLGAIFGTVPAVVPGGQKVLNFMSNGDANGLFYWLGTRKQQAVWSNPHLLGGLITIGISSVGGGASWLLCDRTPNEFYTGNIAFSWISVSINDGGRLKPSYYSLQNRVIGSDISHQLRNWKFQGSNNATVWTDIDTQVNNPVLSGVGSWASFPCESSEFYTYFRILQNGLNSSGANYLTLGEIELYGTYQ